MSSHGLKAVAIQFPVLKARLFALATICPMPYTLCPLLYALCSMPFALCSMLYALSSSMLIMRMQLVIRNQFLLDLRWYLLIVGKFHGKFGFALCQ
jgi:hypothetical protein